MRFSAKSVFQKFQNSQQKEVFSKSEPRLLLLRLTLDPLNQLLLQWPVHLLQWFQLWKFSQMCEYESTSKHGLSAQMGLTYKVTKNSQPYDKSFRRPSYLNSFESKEILWVHIYGYSFPEIQPNCVGRATAKNLKLLALTC